MSIQASGLARIRHADTGEIYTIEPDELDWQEVGADERQMGPEITYEAVIDHPELGQLAWTVSEYPLGAYNDDDHDVGPHQLLENFRLSFSDLSDMAEDREGRVQRMIEWFLARYEDPANSQPHDSGEGGYIWMDGPYDAREQIADRFPDEDDMLIDDAVERVERNGVVDWASIGSRLDENDAAEFDPDDGGNGEDNPETVEGSATDVDGVAERELSDLLAAVPEPAGPLFSRDDANRIELSGWSASSGVDPALLNGLQGQAADLAAQLAGSNGHPELLASVQRYVGALSADAISVAQIYSEGVLLENTATWTETAIKADDRPPLPGSSSATLETVRELHGVLIASSPEGQALLDASARYRRTPETQEALSRSLGEITEALKDTKALFGEELRTMADLVAAQAGQAPQPARSNQTAVAFIGGVIAFTVAEVGKGLFEQIVVGGLAATPVVAGLARGVTALANAAGAFLVNHVDALRTFAATAGPDLGWLQQLVDWIRSRRSRNP
nr:hypothetical protein [uncultured Brevundimonas sp.]